MVDRCIFCHEPVEDDIKTLTKLNSAGHVVAALCHATCYESWRESKPDKDSLTELRGEA